VQATISLDGLEGLLRAIIREELQAGSASLHGRPSGFLDTKGAAVFLSTSEQALRALCKRGQVPVHRTPQGRLLFDPDELRAYVRGEAA
jgi:Helix-turn-helix domain